jgi:ribonuclease E
MTKRLLIDARQVEETRVVLLNGALIEDFDYEAENRKQLKGNVYLARITRVEPSLQAAFVEYGGNRQGFLAFSEIHPDYYRIPVEDREALIEAEAVDGEDDTSDNSVGDAPETIGGEGADEEDIRPKRQVKKYKIQEVISRKQIMLVQVVKEERGNKGAAMTTYLSLAGRYCVLMPNNNRGGGVSRKIINIADRKRLKTVVGGLDIPSGMAVIVRTAGAKRTKTEITRDYSYLSKLWDDIRNRTLESQAPCLIHEEGDLIKRSIRDLYKNEVEEVLVEGDEAYKSARAQMKMLIPSHLKKVQKYQGEKPIFQHYNIEDQMNTIHSPQVTLKSGGYLVINQTEALVAVDVNSGKSTRERNIEETALKTNLEAADELARQLRLRDLSGLIVVDFIDMEDSRNQHAVERRMKDAMKLDRARIQIGSISHFGLLEMSRQRLRISLNESVSNLCPHCEGTGRVRSIETAALQVLRSIEEEAQKGKVDELCITAHRDVVLFILNHKRNGIAEIENRFGLTVILLSDDSLIAPEYRVDRTGWQGKPRTKQPSQQNHLRGHDKSATQSLNEADDEIDENIATNPKELKNIETASDEDQPKRRRRGRRGGRRRRRRTGEDGQFSENPNNETQNQTARDSSISEAANESDYADNEVDGKAAKLPAAKRRGRGRRNTKINADASLEDTTQGSTDTASAKNARHDDTAADDSTVTTAPKKLARVRKKATKAKSGQVGLDATEKSEESEKPAKKKVRRMKAKAAVPVFDASEAIAPSDTNNGPIGDSDEKPARKTTKKKQPSGKSAKKSGNKANNADISDKVDSDIAVSENPTKAAIEKPASTRAPISSIPIDVVEVSSADPAKARRGWWSRS